MDVLNASHRRHAAGFVLETAKILVAEEPTPHRYSEAKELLLLVLRRQLGLYAYQSGPTWNED
jgi:hypothetical protein